MVQDTVPDNSAIRILLAEDDDELRGVLVRALHRVGYTITECRHGLDL